MCSQLSPIPRMGDLWRSTLAWWPPLGAQTCTNHCRTTWVWASMIRIWFGQITPLRQKDGSPFDGATWAIYVGQIIHDRCTICLLYGISLQNKPPMNNNTHKNIPPVYDPVTHRLDLYQRTRLVDPWGRLVRWGSRFLLYCHLPQLVLAILLLLRRIDLGLVSELDVGRVALHGFTVLAHGALVETGLNKKKSLGCMGGWRYLWSGLVQYHDI